MNRIGLLIVTIAALLSSCARESLPPELVPLCLSTGVETKTSLSGTSVKWTSDDQIAVFDDLHYRNRFEAVSVDGSDAVFEGKVTARTTDFYAVYPYSGAVGADSENIYVMLPADQQPVAGSFAEEHNVSIAHGTKAAEDVRADGLVFENTCALLKFTVPAIFSSIGEASFTADNRALAGKMIYSKDEKSVVGVTEGSNTVTLEGQLKGGKEYFFVVSPGEVNGFSLSITDSSNGVTLTNESTKSFEAKAGTIQDLGEVKIVVKPRVWAQHVYSGGKHVRTDVWMDLGLPSGMEEYVESVEGWLQPMGGSVSNLVRTISMSKDRGNVKFPYLLINPFESFGNKMCLSQGSYVANITYLLSGSGYVNTTVVAEIPAP